MYTYIIYIKPNENTEWKEVFRTNSETLINLKKYFNIDILINPSKIEHFGDLFCRYKSYKWKIERKIISKL